MEKRIAAIWFPHLLTDWMVRKDASLKNKPFALAELDRGRRIIKAVNQEAQRKGVFCEMVVADCKALVPDLQVFDFDADQSQKLLNALAEWCVRFSPYVSIDQPDGLFLDTSGCTHLWGGEENYLNEIQKRFQQFGYKIHSAIADTIGTAWALSRKSDSCIVPSGKEKEILFDLPPWTLRVETEVLDKLSRLGLQTNGSFMQMPRTALRRRFGQGILTRIDQALGAELEMTEPIKPLIPYQERLPSLDPIRTAPGIEIAIKNLLEIMCARFTRENKGLRKCELTCYRMDGNIQRIFIGTNKPSRNTAHLFRLFEPRICEIDPGLGIELFILEAPLVEDLFGNQDALWTAGNSDETAISELIDKIAGKTGEDAIQRFLPAEHFWPERSYKTTTSLSEPTETQWRTGSPRPVHLLKSPEHIDVTVPLPDYPPMLFRYRGILHTVKKADGPERIEQEWWIQQGNYRDYYCLENEHGARYWVFRAGDYKSGDPKWFVHGFFA